MIKSSIKEQKTITRRAYSGRIEKKIIMRSYSGFYSYFYKRNTNSVSFINLIHQIIFKKDMR